MKKKQEPIRIAQIIGKWVGGGVEAVVMNYYRHIDRDKIQFDFICDNDSTNIPYEEIEKLGGRVILIPPYQKVFAYQKELIKIFKENEYKIVHSHINTLSVFPLRAAKKVGVPVRIAHSHSTSSPIEWKRNLLKTILRRFSRVYSTEYFSCSEIAGRYQFGDKVYNEGKIKLINNAINIDDFKFNKSIRRKKRKELNIDDDTFVIGHIGRFVETKNHSFLIDVFNDLHKKKKNTMLLLVGQGPLKGEIKEKVELLDLSDSVIFTGQVNGTKELYQVFDVLLFPSLYEGLGLVAIEAQCSGLKCVCSKNVPLEANITGNIKYIDVKENVTVWSEELLKLLEQSNRIDCSNEISLKNYNILNEVLKLECEYLKLISKVVSCLK